jgi:hypothetical protein
MFNENIKARVMSSRFFISLRLYANSANKYYALKDITKKTCSFSATGFK